MSKIHLRLKTKLDFKQSTMSRTRRAWAASAAMTMPPGMIHVGTNKSRYWGSGTGFPKERQNYKADAHDFFQIKPLVESVDLGYAFKISGLTDRLTLVGIIILAEGK